MSAQLVQGQQPEPETPPGAGIKVAFRPSIAIVVGIFTMIFSLTFLLLMYAKFCHPSTPPSAATDTGSTLPPAPGTTTGGGVAKAVVESLPFFRFAALRGARQGLECAVCLARFDDADLLRLLPRCRHAFHLDCVDRWLHSNASCPLCRARVDADDAAELGLKFATASARFVFAGSGDDDDAAAAASEERDDALQTGIFVERVRSARFNLDEPPEPEPELDRHEHRIVVSDALFKSRWSDLNTADLAVLDNRMKLMLRSTSSGLDDDISALFQHHPHHQDKEEEDEDGILYIDVVSPPSEGRTVEKKRLLVDGQHHEKKSKRSGICGGSSDGVVEPTTTTVGGLAASSSRLITSGVRSMSEIVRLPRRMNETRTEEEEMRRWVPIARRTARWFATRPHHASASSSPPL
ncbi:hypothetical protein BRADI_2g14170v3 [Brachypodium distachyon]|uniref:RING-type E3 ubiquitin transferase n=2 Tax=Brachypodium distachyon TaxID=15368 RepID=A0A0Q3QSR6_BRADI|nr:hypothetical protein BRADI_2g14170v3 [Brachypodium distachyon]